MLKIISFLFHKSNKYQIAVFCEVTPYSLAGGCKCVSTMMPSPSGLKVEVEEFVLLYAQVESRGHSDPRERERK
jgi:hypothetical protein